LQVIAGAAGGGVPGDDDGLAGDLERDGPLDGGRGAVAGLAGAEELFRVLDRDFDGPPARDGRRFPFTQGRPGFPVRPGGRPCSAASLRSRVVQEIPAGRPFGSPPA
jgi:hypothetical protein